MALFEESVVRIVRLLEAEALLGQMPIVAAKWMV